MGLRVSELCSLTLDNVQWQQRSLRVTGAEELARAMRTSTRSGARLGFLVLLKTFQRLG
jgi:site-specific recombinase XerD